MSFTWKTIGHRFPISDDRFRSSVCGYLRYYAASNLSDSVCLRLSGIPDSDLEIRFNYINSGGEISFGFPREVGEAPVWYVFISSEMTVGGWRSVDTLGDFVSWIRMMKIGEVLDV